MKARISFNIDTTTGQVRPNDLLGMEDLPLSAEGLMEVVAATALIDLLAEAGSLILHEITDKVPPIVSPQLLAVLTAAGVGETIDGYLERVGEKLPDDEDGLSAEEKVAFVEGLPDDEKLFFMAVARLLDRKKSRELDPVAALFGRAIPTSEE